MVVDSKPLLGHMVENPSKANRCETSLYDPVRFPWHSIREAVMTAERINFPQLPETEETLFGLFFHPESIVGIVTDPYLGLNRLAGFSLVVPEEVEYSLPHTEFGDRLKDADPDTGYVHCTQFLPEFQNMGLVVKLHDEVIKEAAKIYDFLVRDAKKAKKYADNLLTAYGDDVIEHFPHPSIYGEQEYIRIRLKTDRIIDLEPDQYIMYK